MLGKLLHNLAQKGFCITFSDDTWKGMLTVDIVNEELGINTHVHVGCPEQDTRLLEVQIITTLEKYNE